MDSQERSDVERYHKLRRRLLADDEPEPTSEEPGHSWAYELMTARDAFAFDEAVDALPKAERKSQGFPGAI